MTTKEIWKRIEGHPNHFVSNMGNVKSVDHIVSDKGRPSHRKGRILSLTVSGNGYIRVVLEGKCHSVHRLVATAFVPKPESCNVVNHLNGVKTDNRAVNLEWTTFSGNMAHAYRIGLNVMTPERRSKTARSHIGLRWSEETRAKQALIPRPKGYKLSEETRRRISASITKWHKERKYGKDNQILQDPSGVVG